MTPKNFLSRSILLAAFGLFVLIGCSTTPNQSGYPPAPPAPSALDRFLFQIKTQQLAQVTQVTNYVFTTNMVPVYNERVVHQWHTNDVGSVNLYTNIFITTNILFQTSFSTNVDLVTNLVAAYDYTPKQSVKEGVGVGGGILNTFFPGVGGLISTAVVGALGLWGRYRSRKAGAALVQGVETAREIIKRISTDPTIDTRIKEFLIDHQKELGAFELVSDYVEKFRDKPAAKEDAQEILDERTQQVPPPG